ncbi:MAG: cation:dicarboxylase symporter family transporter [Azonexus sp.]|nr:cation:dicarboxylase symporter family transporter [Azonexus sp.]
MAQNTLYGTKRPVCCFTPLRFWRGSREALVTAFATRSSAATPPVTLRCAEQHLHVKKDIANFVIPLGATMNMDGTALYEAAAALFIARLAGIELDLAQQLIIFSSLCSPPSAPPASPVSACQAGKTKALSRADAAKNRFSLHCLSLHLCISASLR